MGIRNSIAQTLRTVAGSITNPKIFVDLDNTLTDFNQAVKDLGPKPTEGLPDDATEEQKQVMYDAIEEAGSKFWSEMKWHPDGKALWGAIKEFEPVLLSSPGLFTYAPAGKEDWVNKNLPGVPLFLESDKYGYAEREAILIDDNKENVNSWKEAGGLAIFHEDARKTEDELMDLIK